MTANQNLEGNVVCPPGLHRLDHLQATLPTALSALETWLPWLPLARGNGKVGKVPAMPKRGSLRPIDCRGVGLPLPEAHSLAQRHGAGGLGVVLAPALELTVLDLDLPLGALAGALLREGVGYAERSPGGGVHMWLAGSSARNRRQAGVEVLGKGFVTVTGEHLRERGRALGELSEVMARLGEASAPCSPQREATMLVDREVLDRLYSAANGARARPLLETGDWSGAGYCSASEADFAALRMLRFYTRDIAQLRRLMFGTALLREKWRRGDYLERTIERALAMGGPIWQPRSKRW